MANSKDVARLANVSVSTVSRAFREDCYISDDTKLKVYQAARELGYTPNLVARSLRNQRSGVIGLIVSDIDNVFYSTVIRVMESEIKKAGYRLILTYSNESPELELENLEMLASSRVEGIIFTPTTVKNYNRIAKLKSQGIPFVQMYRVGFRDIDAVVVDNRRGAYLATRHLIRNGHSNIVLLTVDQPLDSRTAGYKEAFAEEDMPVNDSHIIYLPYHSELKGTISQTIAQIKPTAVIAATNIIGMEFLKACKEMKWSVPDDISLVMFDDVGWASVYDISTVSQPIQEIGQAVCRAMLNQIKQQNPPVHPVVSTFEPFLISRNSVKNLYDPAELPN